MQNLISTKTKVHLSAKISEETKAQLESEAEVKGQSLSNYINDLLEQRHSSARGISIPELLKLNESIMIQNDMLILLNEDLESKLDCVFDIVKDEPDERNILIEELKETSEFHRISFEALQDYVADVEKENEALKDRINQLENAVKIISSNN